MLGTEYLTESNPGPLTDRINATVSGQATWVDLGANRKCADCRFFNLNADKKIPRKSDCTMTQRLARKKTSPKFSRDARACPHFDARAQKRELAK